jgi:murein DD-endopeptidase MepM/ murein hydrolase activator NlpD
VFESYLAPTTGVAPVRDLASIELWETSLQRSLRRRELAERHRCAAPKTKGTAAAVSAALLLSPVLTLSPAAVQSGGASAASAKPLQRSKPLLRQLEGRILRRGDVGTVVAQVQRMIGVTADGIFGPITARALRDFQSRAGLPRTGKVDARTRAALAAAAPATPAPATGTQAPATPAPATAAPTPAAGCAPALVAPVSGTRSAGFGDGRHHQGVDIAAPIGRAVRAAACGIVSFTGTQSGYGRMICVQHTPSFSTCYAHLSTIEVARGARVGPGQLIGRVGMTGRTSGPHLHFETRVDGQPRDPAPYLSGARTIPGLAPAPAPAPAVAAARR